MSRRNITPFKLMSTVEAAETVLLAGGRLVALDERDIFARAAISGIHASVDRRRRSGFITDPTKPEEVMGLITATLGGNDHMADVRAVRDTLQAFTVGFLQTDIEIIDQVRNRITGDEYGDSN